MVKIRLLLVSLLVFGFFGCKDEVEQGASEMHWDRDMCSRCVMVISDRKNTVQLRDEATKKVYKFDDIGCMAIWLSDQNTELKNKAPIWITDVESGEWINAREAFYTTGNITPMAFGFSAHKSKESIKKGEDIISYEEVLKRIK